jgi:hypothetical protein
VTGDSSEETGDGSAENGDAARTFLSEPPFFTRLKPARRVLIAGAGGGFDVYAGLPLAVALSAQGKRVHLANLSFAYLDALPLTDWIDQDVAQVHAGSASLADYFPERALAEWLGQNPDVGIAPVVYAFPKVGVRPLRAAYRSLLAHLGGVDAIVLVDGGTDILLRGDESSLGTPEEDIASLAAVHGLNGEEVPQRIVACLGFGIDSYHGVNHALVLENLASLRRDGAYLGVFDIPQGSREEGAYLDAVTRAQAATPIRPSIVNGQIAAALRGEFGNAQFTRRTAGSDLFVNPLMSAYFTVDLDGLARANQYLARIEDTVLMRQVSACIEAFREELPERRAPRQYPH